MDYRVACAAQYGVDAALNAGRQDTVQTIMDWTHGRGVDVTFDTARSSDTPTLACQVTRPAGRCIFTGISGTESDPFPVSVARRKELCIQWCRRFRHDFARSILLAATGRVNLASLVTHSFPLERTQEAFELVSRFADNVLKASVDL